jgi:hypothetical protein
MRLKKRSVIGIRYEVKRPAMVRETMALKATDDAMLMIQMIAVRKPQKKTAFKGREVRVLTWEKNNIRIESMRNGEFTITGTW